MSDPNLTIIELDPKIYHLAIKENLVLTQEHKIIIKLLINFYQEFNTIPSTRALINYIKTKDQQLIIDSILFAKLFPQGIGQACKIAMLPGAGSCI